MTEQQKIIHVELTDAHRDLLRSVEVFGFNHRTHYDLITETADIRHAIAKAAREAIDGEDAE